MTTVLALNTGNIIAYAAAGLVILAAAWILFRFIRRAVKNAGDGCASCQPGAKSTSGACAGCPMARECRSASCPETDEHTGRD